MPTLDFNNKIAISTTEFTTESSGCIYGGIRSNNASTGLYLIVNGSRFNAYDASGATTFISIAGIPIGTTLKLEGTPNTNTTNIYFIPYIN